MVPRTAAHRGLETIAPLLSKTGQWNAAKPLARYLSADRIARKSQLSTTMASASRFCEVSEEAIFVVVEMNGY